MTEFDKFWMEMVKQQPRLLEGSEQIAFTVTAFRLILEHTWGEAQRVAKGEVFKMGELPQGD